MEKEPFSKEIKVVGQTGLGKVVKIEWRFLTSDGAPHVVKLRHDQTKQEKTRKVVLVDGNEKYNVKSKAKSFQLEINWDIVVLKIESSKNSKKYQYKMTINDKTFNQALNAWKNQNGKA